MYVYCTKLGEEERSHIYESVTTVVWAMLENDREFHGLKKVQWGIVHLHKKESDLMSVGLLL